MQFSSEKSDLSLPHKKIFANLLLRQLCKKQWHFTAVSSEQD